MTASIRWRVDRRDLARRLVHQAAADGLFEAAEVLLEESNRTVPIEEAILAGSGTTSVDDDQLVAAVAYDTPYAVRQHEDTRLRHDPGRRAKWLERTLYEQATRLVGHVQTRIRQVL